MNVTRGNKNFYGRYQLQLFDNSCENFIQVNLWGFSGTNAISIANGDMLLIIGAIVTYKFNEP